ncbi:hypothetical protein FJZ41_01205 [Candidatus Shapirobacteria bacterium]|nr:hypothetical protein [Candidatus Shapirobacteria bacterium]
MSKFFYVFLIFLSLFLLLFSRPSSAQTDITVSIQVGDTIMTFSGKTSPLAQVSFLESGAVLGTTTANTAGDFNKSLLLQNPGLHTYSVFTTDTNGDVSSTVNYSVSLINGTETTLSNIILPPTINLSATDIGQGDTFKISGLTVIASTVTLFINGTSHTYSTSVGTTSEADGTWIYNFGTGGLAIGNYNIYAKTNTTGGYQSEASEILNFKIQAAFTPTSAAGTPGAPTTAVAVGEPGVTPTPEIELPALLRFFDVDGSGRIEVSEIFESVRMWVDLWRRPFVQTCDLNNDHVCNIIDFSVLMYYIGY